MNTHDIPARAPWLAYSWAVSLIIVWGAVAVALKQPLWVTQDSRDLVAFGALKGADFRPGEAWRLLASQWLHVKPPHMLLNAVIIAIVGRAVEARTGALALLAVGLVGGTLGQLAAVYGEPTEFISGASQATFAMCGFVLLAARIKSYAWASALVGVLSGLTLDVVVSGHGAFKPGHLVGLIFGLVVGLVWRSRAKHHPL